MKYLEQTIQFTIKNYLVFVPMLLGALIVSAFVGTAASPVAELTGLVQQFNTTGEFSFDRLAPVFAYLSTVAVGGSALATLFQFVTQPTTAGLIKKGLMTDKIVIDDFVPAFSENVVKFVMFFLGRIVLMVIMSIIGFLVLVVLIALAFMIGEMGIALAIIGLIGFGVLMFVISVLTSFWFAAMVFDDYELIDGFKKSIKVAKRCFFTLVFISILITLVAGIISLVLSIFSFIPLIGSVMVALAATLGGVLQMVFAFILYQDKKQLIQA